MPTHNWGFSPMGGSKMPSSLPAVEELMSQAAEDRHWAALCAYDDLMSLPSNVNVQHAGLIHALLQVADAVAATSLTEQAASLMSPRNNQSVQEQQVSDFLHARGTHTLHDRGFEAFLELYNEWVDYRTRLSPTYSVRLGSSPRLLQSPRSTVPSGESADRVINMATSAINARLNDSSSGTFKRPTPRDDDRSYAPTGMRAGSTPRGGLTNISGAVLDASNEAPSLEGIDHDAYEKSGRKKRGGRAPKSSTESPRVRETAFDCCFFSCSPPPGLSLLSSS